VYVAAETQTGKTLLFLYVARLLMAGGALFGKFAVTPVDRLLYFVLEDPDRRIHDRLLDISHEFPAAPLDPERCIFQVAPGFALTDDKMWQWFEQVITTERRSVVCLDTYQKATPGINSFDDEEQSLILHKLADVTRRLGITLVILDHVRKQGGGTKRRGDLSIDDIKGTGGKAQNADCVILLERTPDKKQIKFQAFSKDFDQPVRILVNVAPRGSAGPKFTYAADLEQLGAGARDRRAERKQKMLDAMKPGVWVSAPGLAKAVGYGRATVHRYLQEAVKDGLVEEEGVGSHTRYRRIVQSQSQSQGNANAN